MFHELEQVLRGVYLIGDLSPKIFRFYYQFRWIVIEPDDQLRVFAAKVDNEFLDARKIIRTDRNFGSAHVLFEITNKNIVEYFKEHKKLQVITGFISLSQENETTTLGRGGSDYTVSIFGAALKS